MGKSQISKSILFLAVFFLAATIVRADSLFTFESDPVGTATGFSNTSNGVTATFRSSADPDGFEVFPPLGFVTLTGNFLAQGPNSPAFLPLSIAFGNNLNFISMNFGLDGPGAFTLMAYEGSTLVGTVSAIGVIPDGSFEPEGLISFDGATFDSVVLTSSTDFFGVDNIDVKSTGVPEPGTLAMLGMGVLALVLCRPRIANSLKS
ncbi:MAG: PEP-CTERM sorting domain-containing protein [Candidatus Acidiferrales bacterium]